MKPVKPLLSFILLIFILNSCSIEKRTFNKGYHIQWISKRISKDIISSIDKNEDEDERQMNIEAKYTPIVSKIDFAQMDIIDEPNQINQESKVSYKLKEQLIPPVDECDVILLNNGDEISAKVIEIGINEVKYKKCDNINGPLFTISKNSIFSIKYSNGSKDVFTNLDKKSSNTNHQNNNTSNKKIGFAIASLILGILGFGILAVFFGSVQLDKIERYPDEYGGKEMSIAGIILGCIGMLILLIILLA